MDLVKLQKNAKTRMKEGTYLFGEEKISAVRFFGMYYANFVFGMAIACLRSSHLTSESLYDRNAVASPTTEEV